MMSNDKLSRSAEAEIWTLLGQNAEEDMQRWNAKFGTRREVVAEDRDFLAACRRLKEEIKFDLQSQVEESEEEISTRNTDAEIYSLLDPEIQQKLRAEGILHFFDIQQAVLPSTLKAAQMRFTDHGLAKRDVCVAAPTGSGKTLIYALTLIQFLLRRKVKRLRAIVVVPSRELARQIHGEIARFLPTINTTERLDLCCEHSGGLRPQEILGASNESADIPDILISTPGRLTERVRACSLNLEHLDYLIADEADRLTQQYYQGWARKLLATRHAAVSAKQNAIKRLEHYWNNQQWQNPSLIGYRDRIPAIPTCLRLRKLLFSATLGDDPRLLTTLLLSQPLFFYVGHEKDKSSHPICVTSSPLEAARGKYVLSKALIREEAVLCDAATKPLCLLASLDSFFIADTATLTTKSVMLFCNSVDTSLRLAALLKLIYEEKKSLVHYTVLELSSAASPARRDAVFTHFRNCASHAIIVASDAGSRGIDLPNLGLVINYDLPSDTRTYVHRLGRTARAQQPGAALTLIKKGQEAVFARLRANIDSMTPKPEPISRSKLKPLTSIYKAALAKLKPKLEDIRTGASARKRKQEEIAQDHNKSPQPVQPNDDDDIIMSDASSSSSSSFDQKSKLLDLNSDAFTKGSDADADADDGGGNNLLHDNNNIMDISSH